MLTYYEANRTEQQEPTEFLQWKAKTIEKPDTTSIARYKAELTMEEINTFENLAKVFLERYSYCNDTNP
jgi:hypothetical protein